MAIFSFIKDAGKEMPEMGEEGASSTARASEKAKEGIQTTKSNSPAAEKMEKNIHDHNFRIENLSILVEEEIAHVSGKVKDQGTKEKVILVIGNTKGIAEVNEDIEVVDAAPESQFHTVSSADTLISISEKIYGDADKFQEIIEANAPMVNSSADIYPGQVLRIPSTD